MIIKKSIFVFFAFTMLFSTSVGAYPKQVLAKSILMDSPITSTPQTSKAWENLNAKGLASLGYDYLMKILKYSVLSRIGMQKNEDLNGFFRFVSNVLEAQSRYYVFRNLQTLNVKDQGTESILGKFMILSMNAWAGDYWNVFVQSLRWIGWVTKKGVSGLLGRDFYVHLNYTKSELEASNKNHSELFKDKMQNLQGVYESSNVYSKRQEASEFLDFLLKAQISSLESFKTAFFLNNDKNREEFMDFHLGQVYHALSEKGAKGGKFNIFEREIEQTIRIIREKNFEKNDVLAALGKTLFSYEEKNQKSFANYSEQNKMNPLYFEILKEIFKMEGVELVNKETMQMKEEQVLKGVEKLSSHEEENRKLKQELLKKDEIIEKMKSEQDFMEKHQILEASYTALENIWLVLYQTEKDRILRDVRLFWRKFYKAEKEQGASEDPFNRFLLEKLKMIEEKIKKSDNIELIAEIFDSINLPSNLDENDEIEVNNHGSISIVKNFQDVLMVCIAIVKNRDKLRNDKKTQDSLTEELLKKPKPGEFNPSYPVFPLSNSNLPYRQRSSIV